MNIFDALPREMTYKIYGNLCPRDRCEFLRTSKSNCDLIDTVKPIQKIWELYAGAIYHFNKGIVIGNSRKCDWRRHHSNTPILTQRRKDTKNAEEDNELLLLKHHQINQMYLLVIRDSQSLRLTSLRHMHQVKIIFVKLGIFYPIFLDTHWIQLLFINGKF